MITPRTAAAPLRLADLSHSHVPLLLVAPGTAAHPPRRRVPASRDSRRSAACDPVPNVAGSKRQLRTPKRWRLSCPHRYARRTLSSWQPTKRGHLEGRHEAPRQLTRGGDDAVRGDVLGTARRDRQGLPHGSSRSSLSPIDRPRTHMRAGPLGPARRHNERPQRAVSDQGPRRVTGVSEVAPVATVSGSRSRW